MKYSFPTVICIFCLLACAQMKKEVLQLSSGNVERHENFDSKFVAQRNIDVWLPDNYTDKENYTVLYMHDGQMLFDGTQSWNKQEWGVDETMNKLLAANEIRPTIIVGIWNTEFRHAEYFPQKPFESLPKQFKDSLLNVGKNQESALFKTKICSDNYLKFIVQELKPFIDDKYSTRSDMKNTYIAGSSMGGLISMYALSEYPEVFHGAACLSTHWPGTFDTLNNPIPSKFAEYLNQHVPNPETHLLYFDYGTETLDALYEPYQKMIDSIMVKNKYSDENWKTLKFEGEDHSEKAWSKRLDIPLKFLLKE